MESNRLNYIYNKIGYDEEYSNPLNNHTKNINSNPYSYPNSNINSNPYSNPYSYPYSNTNSNSIIFHGTYFQAKTNDFFLGSKETVSYLPMDSSNFNERLIVSSIDLEYIIYLKIILVLVTGIFIGVIGLGWLMSFIIWLNQLSLIVILIYGFVINLMIGFMLSKIDLLVNINNQTNIQTEILSNGDNLYSLVSKLAIEKKMIILLFIIGLGCTISPILYLLNKISWIIPLSMETNLIVGIIYLIKRLGEIKQTDAKELYQNKIPFEMIKTIIANTIFSGLIELVFNTSMSESSVKTFILIILTNFILFYIYWYQIKITILDSEELYYYGDINLFTNLLVQPIKMSKIVKNFFIELFTQNH